MHDMHTNMNEYKRIKYDETHLPEFVNVVRGVPQTAQHRTNRLHQQRPEK